MPKLWIFGDSFSETNEGRFLVKWRTDYINWKKYVPKVFSDFLSANLGMPCRNLGIGGADNYTIMDSIIDSLNKIDREDIIIIGWSSTIRFRVASREGSFLTVRPDNLNNKDKNSQLISTISNTSYLTDISVDALNEIIVNRCELPYVDEINRYIKLINHIYPDNIIINWSPFKQEEDGLFVTPIKQKIETIFEETNGEIYDMHFSENGNRQMSEYLYDLIKSYDNTKKVKLL